jgi:DNA invertase Pin-like site-specific DNA recombinase
MQPETANPNTTNKPPGQRIAYRRVSTLDQSTARQLDGLTFDRVFEDKASGKDTQRPALQEALAYVRTGDTLTIHSMDRLARNLADLLRIVGDLTRRRVKVEFVKESLTFTGEDSPMATLMLSIMGAVAAFERAMILERQREGVALAKRCAECGKTRAEHEDAKHKFTNKYHGRAPAIRQGNGKQAELEKMAATGAGVAEMARAVGVSRQTVYSWLAMRKAAESKEVAA